MKQAHRKDHSPEQMHKGVGVGPPTALAALKQTDNVLRAINCPSFTPRLIRCGSQLCAEITSCSDPWHYGGMIAYLKPAAVSLAFRHMY